ncbi:hypothetical protein L484_018762 [Morus notabilis]|uniref:Uncharacterized protein n=1 Tax=Morus notabilis TaxID=981085 RepID=W9RIP9_9ROSA|nr:hypothetical protein L484_018762 [Morus notabilis]
MGNNENEHRINEEQDIKLANLSQRTLVVYILAEFLNLCSLTFLGMRIKQYMADLERDHGLKCRNAVGLGTLAAASRLGASIGTKAYDFVKLAETT